MSTFPNDETGNTLKLFEQNGFDLAAPMEIDFFVAVPSESTGMKIAMEVTKLGFTTSVELDEESQDWTCYCTQTLIPKYSEVVGIEKELDRIARLFGGVCDGFGTFGNT